MSDETTMPFDFSNGGTPSIIKVIGVGGGGGNAVNHMYREGIHDVTFVVCNTDNQALRKSPVPVKLQLGREGLGAGNRPARAKAAAEESMEDIENMLNDGCKMVFITAGMGGGTGTGAAPIIAKTAKDMGILTVGIVTIPFLFEGRPKIVKALKGVREMAKNVDALLVINNERLRKLSAEERLSVPKAYKKADETLTIAAKSIAEIITIELVQNVDFADVDTTMRNSGVALMSIGYGEGEKRLQHAIDRALHNSLLNDNDNIFNAKRLLFVIYFSEEAELGMDEMQDIHDFMAHFKTEYEVKWGFGYDNTLGQQIKITILATGFGVDDILAEERGMEAEMDKRQAEEEERIRKQKEEEENAWINQAYGEEIDIRPRAEVTILTMEQLDDDNAIALLEETPTYMRGRFSNSQPSRSASKSKQEDNASNKLTIQF